MLPVARSKEFNEEEVLDKAVDVFWAKGYEATSIQDLVHAMGIQRGSLYATFGGKQQLFLTALNRYGDVVVKSLLSILTSKPSAQQSIHLFFSQLVEHLLNAGPLRSCLVTNSAIERGLADEATRKKVCALLNAIEKGFYQALLNAQKQNEVSSDLNLTATAYFLTSSMQGLIVMGKVCQERSVLESINQITLSVLK
jgi:TetR/AcrR family transcriptional repressor of nem operon